MQNPVISRLSHWTVAALLGLAVVELLFRLVIFPGWRDLNHDMYRPHPVFGIYTRPDLNIHRLKPGNWDVRVHTNALGMRGRAEDMTAELAGLWIMGDSNTFGGYLNDDEVYSARLAGFGLRAANLASEGHAVDRQARVLRWLVAEGRRPRAVVAAVSLYHGIKPYQGAVEDLSRPLPQGEAAVAPGGAVRRLRDGVLNTLDGLPRNGFAMRVFLGSNSALYNWVKSGIMGIPALRAWTLRHGLRTDLDMVYAFDLDLLRPLDPGNPALGDVRATADLLAAMGDLVHRELGVPFGVILLPTHHQIHPAAFARWRSANHLDGDDLDPVRPLTALEDELRRRGVAVTDPLAALRASPVRTIFPDDGHLNATGHRIVAEHLAAWLPSALGVEPRP